MDRREDQEFDKLFKAALEKEESTLHDGVWESIAKEIHTSSERRLGYVWWYRVAASVALFISLGVSLMTMPLKNAGELASTRALNVDAISNDEVWLGNIQITDCLKLEVERELHLEFFQSEIQKILLFLMEIKMVHLIY